MFKQNPREYKQSNMIIMIVNKDSPFVRFVLIFSFKYARKILDKFARGSDNFTRAGINSD